MPGPVPVRRALAAVVTAGALVAAGVVASGGASAQTLPDPIFPAATASASTSASAVPSASATPTPTVSASPSASATAAPCPVPVPGIPCIVPGGGSSPSATPTASTTTSASPSPTPTGPEQPGIAVAPTEIVDGEQSQVRVSTAPGNELALMAYTRPRTEYTTVRTATADQDGRATFTVAPRGNTRLFVRSTDDNGSTDSRSIVIKVASRISLRVERTGTRTYRFTGSATPARPGQVVRITYRKDSGQVEATRAKAGSKGVFSVVRTFSGTGTLDFTARTSTDITNAGGTSPVRRTTVR